MGKRKKSVPQVPTERIERAILLLRGQRVILDADLAALYGVATARLNQQVRRNINRFPDDFAFQLTKDEFDDLKLHFATSSSGWGGRRKPPLAFTEHGALMAANVLKSPQAVETSVQVVRAFVRLREMLATHKELARRLDELERSRTLHRVDCDEDIPVLPRQILRFPTGTQVSALRQLGIHVELKIHDDEDHFLLLARQKEVLADIVEFMREM